MLPVNNMNASPSVIVRQRGQDRSALALEIDGRTVVVSGRFIQTATVHDEAHVEGEIVPEPEAFIRKLKEWEVKPDLFTFQQKFTDSTPRHPYYCEMLDFAVIPITTYEHWQRNQIKKDVKENLRRAKREGVEVRAVPFDDSFVQGVKDLYDETPVRQGRRFWHYGKSIDKIKEIHGTYENRSEFIAAFLGDEFIGFLKMVYTDEYAKTMHVISKERHFSKRPTSAMIAKAVEICAEKGKKFLVYGEYTFDGRVQNSLTDFKRHNGFEPFPFPRYFVPLTRRGKLALQLGLHHDWRTRIPQPVTKYFLSLRSRYYRRFASRQS
jgi:hypothetical protein